MATLLMTMNTSFPGRNTFMLELCRMIVLPYVNPPWNGRLREWKKGCSHRAVAGAERALTQLDLTSFSCFYLVWSLCLSLGIFMWQEPWMLLGPAWVTWAVLHLVALPNIVELGTQLSFKEGCLFHQKNGKGCFAERSNTWHRNL